jgi:hypothetical protein
MWLRALLVGTTVVLLVGVVDVGPATAGKGRNNGTAHACGQGGWQRLGVFENQGDCVNDGAQVGDFGDAGLAACSAIPGFVARDWRLEPTSSWGCTYAPGANPPDDPYSKSLQAACSSDTNAAGTFSAFSVGAGRWVAVCDTQPPGGRSPARAANPLR